jgi:hypothetical protein
MGSDCCVGSARGHSALTRRAHSPWSIPAGPATIRYTAVIRNGVRKKVGDRVMPGKDPVRFFEMGAAGAVGPQ